MSDPSTPASRALAWAGCENVRELGGLPIEAGGTTARGVVVRADNVRGLTEGGWEAAMAHGAQRIVDLRWHEELGEDPAVDVPVEVLHIPVLGPHRPEGRYDRFAALAAEVPDSVEFARRLYGEYLDEFPTAFARAVEAVAAAPGLVVLHCTAGKDRTGLVVALLLRVVGVGIEVVADDYALTDASRLLRRGLVDGMSEEEVLTRRYLLDAPALGMANLLEDLDSRYGSAADYLLQAGIDPTVPDVLRRRLGADPG
jgi:protein tyrosine/serine phosphatase